MPVYLWAYCFTWHGTKVTFVIALSVRCVYASHCGVIPDFSSSHLAQNVPPYATLCRRGVGHK